MPISVLDTNELIAFFHRKAGGQPLANFRESDASGWARELIVFHDTDAIVTPVLVEFLAGARNAQELKLYRAYLAAFRVVDDRKILPQDWDEAQRLATWVPRDGKPRQMGDCLIRALAIRLRLGVVTRDRAFPTR